MRVVRRLRGVGDPTHVRNSDDGGVEIPLVSLEGDVPGGRRGKPKARGPRARPGEVRQPHGAWEAAEQTEAGRGGRGGRGVAEGEHDLVRFYAGRGAGCLKDPALGRGRRQQWKDRARQGLWKYKSQTGQRRFHQGKS
jgi:hypothetical protein